ncbi:MAG: protein translocase subunit SecF, partial [Candidatus Cloacimonetes bacterium]|nr:protein translocase subunit SecF [Candidatus Cloacimonadota bacterium]
RIREDLKLYRKKPFADVINRSINETLSRTIITSLTTFVVVLSLYLFGGSVIHDFAFALLIGVVVGTYSSIFIASPILVEHFTRRQEKRLKK